MANEIANMKALSECSSRIREELSNVKHALSSAMSRAEEVLQHASAADGSESLDALRVLVAEAARVDELSDTCRDALGAIGAIVDPLEQLLAVLGSEVEYWKRRALGGDKLESANEAPAKARHSTGIGSLLHEAIADRLEPALVAELETDTIARMEEEELGAARDARTVEG
jgi:hypothetical protein